MRRIISSLRSGSTRAWVVLGISFLGLLGCFLVKSFSEKGIGKENEALNMSEYIWLVEHNMLNIGELTDWFDEEQCSLIPVLPPNPDTIIVQQGYPTILPFKTKNFPEEFMDGLTSHYEYSVPVYSLTIIRDPATYEIVFINASGKEIYSIKPESDYDPYEFLKAWQPSLYSGAFSQDWIKYQESVYSPARIQITVKLISFNLLEHYLYAKARSQPDLLTIDSEYSGMVMMRSGGVYSNGLWISIEWGNINGSNSLSLTSHLLDGDTNHIDYFACTNLFSPQWVLTATNLDSGITNIITWIDTNAGSFTRRYYTAAKLTDTDGDTLSDAYEHLILGTSEYSDDTDSDGLPDNIDSEPCIYDTNNLSFTITSPTNGMVLP